jgi:FtsH-binding integral membrane protein
VFVPHNPGPDGSSFLQKIKSLQLYLSLGVFSLSIAHDMHQIIQLADMRDFDNASLEEKEVGEEKVDCVRESVNMYVNISGVFVDLIQLLLRDELDKRKKKRDE